MFMKKKSNVPNMKSIFFVNQTKQAKVAMLIFKVRNESVSSKKKKKMSNVRNMSYFCKSQTLGITRSGGGQSFYQLSLAGYNGPVCQSLVLTMEVLLNNKITPRHYR